MEASGKTIAAVDRIQVDVEKGLEVKVAFGDLSSVYRDCQQVRSEAGDQDLHHAFDEWSFQFVMTYRGTPVGSMTATRCSDGPVDQEFSYPHAFLDANRAVTFSSCKLRINDFESRSLATFRFFTQSAWSYLVGLGLRIDVMNCEVDKRSAYEAVGYQCLDGFDFIHSELGTVSRVMVLTADANHQSLFRKSFQALSNPVSQSDLLESFHLSLRAPELAAETVSH